MESQRKRFRWFAAVVVGVLLAAVAVQVPAVRSEWRELQRGAGTWCARQLLPERWAP